jgi:hypothetical protein
LKENKESKYTFLAFVEDGRAWVVDARLIRVGELLATGLVNTFLRHSSERERGAVQRKKRNGGRCRVV